jgi:ClpP class serine protease
VASNNNAAPDQVASDDGIAATIFSIDEAYAESVATIAEGNAMLASIGSSAAEDTIMGGETAHRKRSVDESNDVEPVIDPDL